MAAGRRPSPGRQWGSQRWGFHRLRPSWAERVVAAAGVRPGDLVIDLGAGDGALTEPLLRAGARVIAVELDRGRADRLRDRLVGTDSAVLTLDAREFTYPGRPSRVVANPPFALAVELVRAIAESSRVEAADLVLPYGLVRRFEKGGTLGRMVVSRGLPVPRSAFRPYATQDCAVLRLRRSRS